MKMLKSGKRSGLPNVNLIEIKGHFGTELTRNRTSVMYNENREKETAYFQQCHRTIIINMKKVTCLTDNWVVLNGKEELPVGKKYLEEIRSAFLSQ